MRRLPDSLRKSVATACFVAASVAFIMGSSLLSSGPRPLSTDALREIAGADNSWKLVEDRTCEQQTLSDFNGSSDPTVKDKAKGVVASCGANDVNKNPPTPCWTCAANPAPTHSVFTGGGTMEGREYTPKACGRVSQGECKLVMNEPKCDNPQVLRGYDCTAAQVKKSQFEIQDPEDPETPTYP